MIDTKYAVIIVTYNREQLLKECVNNVENQTIAPDSVIIVNNASTDKTFMYLQNLKEINKTVDIVDLPQNIGGAGGFVKGIEHALKKNVDCVLIMDDDAMIENDYMEQILQERQCHPQYKAFAGTVKTDGKIDTFHRRKLLRMGLKSANCKEQEYKQSCFECDIASFCGMVVDTDILKQIGLPHADYFIWYDDTEYSLRINQYSKFLVIPKAELNHKTTFDTILKPRRYNWKEYYAVRNRILMVKEHGSIMDRMVNFIDIFIHSIFRNWLFGIIKRDGYDWKYEQQLVKKAVKDARSGMVKNVMIKREE